MNAKKKLDTNQVATELSESAYFQQPTSPQAGKPVSTQVDKTTKLQIEKYTTHLSPATIKAVKWYALEHDLKDYEVVQAAIDAFLAKDEGANAATR